MAGILSNESGTYDVYVRPFTPAAPSARSEVAGFKSGGAGPHLAAGRQGVVLPGSGLPDDGAWISREQGISGRHAAALVHRSVEVLTAGWDLSPDGKRFLFVAPPGIGRTIPFTVVLNWAAGLKK